MIDAENVKWAPGDMPHGESTDLNEFPNEVLKLKICRSFRADLLHKLNLIVRSFGGTGNGGVQRTAQRLRVGRHSLQRWRRWEGSPRTRLVFERIDNAYLEAIEKLATLACKKSRA